MLNLGARFLKSFNNVCQAVSEAEQMKNKLVFLQIDCQKEEGTNSS